MINYEETVQPLIDAALLTQGEVYFYQNDPLREVFQLYFDFTTENLIGNQDKYKINPSHFYYANDLEINARAYGHGDHRFIEVNMGAIDRLWTFYQEHAGIFDDERFEHYKGIAEHKDITADFLLFQYTTLYFYYHELGHLIQHNDNDDQFSVNENLIDNANEANSTQSQTLEFDADWYAATQLAFVLVDYYRDGEAGNFACTVEELSDLISLGLSAIFNYYVLSANRFPEIYYRVNSHPHPYVRITYVLTFITDNLNPNLPADFHVDYHSALSQAILLSEEFLMNGIINQAFNFAAVFQREGDNIEVEINRIKRVAEQNPKLTLNQLIKKGDETEN